MVSNSHLQQTIRKVEASLQHWAERHGLWEGCSFHSHHSFYRNEPNMQVPCLTILSAGDDLIRVLKGPYSVITDELDRLADDWHCSFDNTGEHLFFYPYDEALKSELTSFCQWQWLCDLVRPDYTDLHHELYQYFHQRPQELQKLHWRHFEILMSELLRHRGFETLLGPGRNDGGVDITLIDRNALVPFVTLVQVKNQKHPVELEAVAALGGILDFRDERHGLFITSSRFLPGAASFAALHTRRIIELADRTDITNWSFDAAKEIQNCIKKYTSRDYISGLFTLPERSTPGSSLTGRILVTTLSNPFTDTFKPQFAMILHDTRHLALVMQLPSRNTDSHYATGTAIASKTFSLYDREPPDNIIFRVRKEQNDSGDIHFYGQRHLYQLWDGEAQHFMLD